VLPALYRMWHRRETQPASEPALVPSMAMTNS
jgi:hypothetical protein